MIKYILIILICLFLTIQSYAQSSKAIIVDHNCTDLKKIPQNYITKAKQTFRIAFGTKNHGSQITSGMALMKADSGSIFVWDEYGGQSEGQQAFLCFRVGIPFGTLNSLGSPTWPVLTTNLLHPNKDTINVVMWSWEEWAKQLPVASIKNYLRKIDSMEKLNQNVRFIYMTGYIDSTGESGKTNKNNNIIRDFCIENNKILYDFADLEAYDPDGNYFLDKECDDKLNYDSGNWAEEYCLRKPEACDSCSCYQTPCINCQQKAKAFWWLLARMAGWQGDNTIQANLVFSNEIIEFGQINSDQPVELNFQINNTGRTYSRIKKIEIINNKDSLFRIPNNLEMPLFVNASSKNAFNITFTPPEANGKYISNMIITTDNGDFEFVLSADYTGGLGVEDELSNGFSELNVTPNLAKGSTQVKFNLKNSGEVNLSVYNIYGQEVLAIINNEFRNKGKYESNIDLRTLSSGTYIIRLKAGNLIKTGKIVLIQ